MDIQRHESRLQKLMIHLSLKKRSNRNNTSLACLIFFLGRFDLRLKVPSVSSVTALYDYIKKLMIVCPLFVKDCNAQFKKVLNNVLFNSTHLKGYV